MSNLLTMAPPDLQRLLFSVDPVLNCWNNASARNCYGHAAQIIVCNVLGLNPVIHSGSFNVCFDAELAGVYYEIKSCKRNGKIPLYECRIEKEMACDCEQFYAVLVHHLSGARKDILNAMRQKAELIFVLPTKKVYEISRAFPLNPVYKTYSGKNGYSRDGYKRGYRNVPINLLKQQATATYILNETPH